MRRRSVVAMVAVVAVAVGALLWWLPSAAPDVVTGGAAASDRRGWYPSAPAATPEEMRWRRDTSQIAYTAVAAPAVVGDRLFVATGGTVAALGAGTGEVLWRAEVAGAHAVAADLNLVYVLGGGVLSALAAEDGALVWRVRVGSSEAPGGGAGESLSIVAGVATVRTSDGGVAAVTASGRLAWTLRPDDLATSPQAARQRAVAAPVRFGAFALLVTAAADGGRGTVRSLDMATGEPGWVRALAPPTAAPVLVGKLLAVATEAGVVGLDANDGETLWDRPAVDGERPLLAAVSGHVAVVTSVATSLLDARDGSLAMSVEGPRQDVVAVSGPVLALDRRVAAVIAVHLDDGSVVALNPAASVATWRQRHVAAGRAPSRGVPGTVVVPTTDGHVRAFRAADGAPKWSQRIAGTAACDLAGGGDLTLVSSDGRLHAFHAEQGTVAWSHTPDPPVAGVATADGERVAVVDVGGGITLLDARDGNVVARGTSSGDALGGAVLDDGQVVVAGGNAAPPGGLDVSGWIRSLDAATGTSRWVRYALGPLAFPPTVADDSVLAITASGYLQSFGRDSGDSRWRAVALLPPTGPVAVAGDTAVVADTAGRLTAVALATGRQRWQVQLATPLRRQIAIADGLVLVRGDDTSVVAHDLDTGRLRWRSRLAHAVTSPVSVAGERVWVGTRAGLAVLDLATGRQVDEVALDAPPALAPIVGAGGVTVCQANGSVVALGAG